MVEHRGNAPRATSLQGRSEPLLVSLTVISNQEPVIRKEVAAF
jgi:hypothetical protein